MGCSQIESDLAPAKRSLTEISNRTLAEILTDHKFSLKEIENKTVFRHILQKIELGSIHFNRVEAEYNSGYLRLSKAKAEINTFAGKYFDKKCTLWFQKKKKKYNFLIMFILQKFNLYNLVELVTPKYQNVLNGSYRFDSLQRDVFKGAYKDFFRLLRTYKEEVSRRFYFYLSLII